MHLLVQRARAGGLVAQVDRDPGAAWPFVTRNDDAVGAVLGREATRPGRFLRTLSSSSRARFCVVELERAMGLEPTTPGLGSQCSTTELRPRALDLSGLAALGFRRRGQLSANSAVPKSRIDAGSQVAGERLDVLLRRRVR